jgi:hypothetical protein
MSRLHYVPLDMTTSFRAKSRNPEGLNEVNLLAICLRFFIFPDIVSPHQFGADGFEKRVVFQPNGANGKRCFFNKKRLFAGK